MDKECNGISPFAWEEIRPAMDKDNTALVKELFLEACAKVVPHFITADRPMAEVRAFGSSANCAGCLVTYDKEVEGEGAAFCVKECHRTYL